MFLSFFHFFLFTFLLIENIKSVFLLTFRFSLFFWFIGLMLSSFHFFLHSLSSLTLTFFLSFHSLTSWEHLLPHHFPFFGLKIILFFLFFFLHSFLLCENVKCVYLSLFFICVRSFYPPLIGSTWGLLCLLHYSRGSNQLDRSDR